MSYLVSSADFPSISSTFEHGQGFVHPTRSYLGKFENIPRSLLLSTRHELLQQVQYEVVTGSFAFSLHANFRGWHSSVLVTLRHYLLPASLTYLGYPLCTLPLNHCYVAIFQMRTSSLLTCSSLSCGTAGIDLGKLARDNATVEAPA